MTNVVRITAKKESVYEPVPGNQYLRRHRLYGTYYVRARAPGKPQLFESTKTDKLKEAREIMKRVLSEYFDEGKDHVSGREKARRNKTVSAVCAELLLELEKETRHRDESKRRRLGTYGNDVTYLGEEGFLPTHFGRYPVSKLTAPWWKAWVKETGSQMDRTLFDVAKYLSKLTSYATEKGYIQGKPKFENPDPKKKTGRTITDEEFVRLWNVANPRLRLQLVLGRESGMRTGEIRKLEWSMVRFCEDRDGTAYTVIDLPARVDKNKKGRDFRLSVNGDRLMRAWSELKSPLSLFVFHAAKNVSRCQTKKHQNQEWHRALVAAGIKDSPRFYWLRHTFYTVALLDLKAPIAQVSEYGGTSIATLQRRYIHANQERTKETARLVSEERVKLELSKNLSIEKEKRNEI